MLIQSKQNFNKNSNKHEQLKDSCTLHTFMS